MQAPKRRVLLGGITLALAVLAQASSESELTLRPRLKLSSDAPEGMCALGETVTFTAEVRNSSREELKGELRWELETVAFVPEEQEPIEVELEGRETQTFEFELEMKVPGFVKVTCIVAEEGEREVSRRERVGCEPTGVLSELTREDDFDEFWARSLEELAQVDP